MTDDLCVNCRDNSRVSYNERCITSGSAKLQEKRVSIFGCSGGEHGSCNWARGERCGRARDARLGDAHGWKLGGDFDYGLGDGDSGRSTGQDVCSGERHRASTGWARAAANDRPGAMAQQIVRLTLPCAIRMCCVWERFTREHRGGVTRAGGRDFIRRSSGRGDFCSIMRGA